MTGYENYGHTWEYNAFVIVMIILALSIPTIILFRYYIVSKMSSKEKEEFLRSEFPSGNNVVSLDNNREQKRTADELKALREYEDLRYHGGFDVKRDK